MTYLCNYVENVCGSCSSLIESEHTNNAIPSSHSKFQDLSKKFRSLYLTMENHHNNLRKPLVRVNTNMYLYSKGWKWNDNYNDYVKCTVNNLLILEESSSSSSSTSLLI